MRAHPNTDGDPAHRHDFHLHNPIAARRTRQVMWLAAVMMAIEIAAGTVFGSMALLADGWHMSSHVLALGISAAAYSLARRHAEDPRFTFGTWKIEVLGGYTGAVLLLGVAAYMGIESVLRLVRPSVIRFDEALAVAVVGLFVNVASAVMLSSGTQAGGSSDHDHARDPGHAHEHHHDLNLRSAYLHVVTDAFTSVLAIVALAGGKYLGAGWLDPAMGLVGAVLVAHWALGLLRDTGRALLDAELDSPVVRDVWEVVRSMPPPTELRDLHVWRVGKGKYACIVSVATDGAVTSEELRQRLTAHEELVHVTVEVETLRS